MKVKIGFTGTRDDLTDFQKVSLKNYIANIKDKTVNVRLLGHCYRCGISSSTMKVGVESTIKQFAQEIETVVNI